MTTSTQAIDQYCVFEADGDLWAVPALAVREITDAVPIVNVPESPPQLVGICHLRTEFLPVLELRSLLGETGHDHRPTGHLLIFDGSEGPWGLPVQRAKSLQTLEVAMPQNRGESQTSTSPVLGTAAARGEVLRVLDASRLYRIAIDALDAHWGHAFLPATV